MASISGRPDFPVVAFLSEIQPIFGPATFREYGRKSPYRSTRDDTRGLSLDVLFYGFKWIVKEKECDIICNIPKHNYPIKTFDYLNIFMVF